jgi:hypothetical protein
LANLLSSTWLAVKEALIVEMQIQKQGMPVF